MSVTRYDPALAVHFGPDGLAIGAGRIRAAVACSRARLLEFFREAVRTRTSDRAAFVETCVRSVTDACFSACMAAGPNSPSWADNLREAVGVAERAAEPSVSDDAAWLALSSLADAPSAAFEESLRANTLSAFPAAKERRLLPEGGCRPECVEAAARGWQPAGTLPGFTDCGCRCTFDAHLASSPPWEVEGGPGQVGDAEVMARAADAGFHSQRSVDALLKACQVGQIPTADALNEVLLMATAVRAIYLGRDCADINAESAALDEALNYGSLESLRGSIAAQGAAPDVPRRRLILDWCDRSRLSAEPQVSAMSLRFDPELFPDRASALSWCDANDISAPDSPACFAAVEGGPQEFLLLPPGLAASRPRAFDIAPGVMAVAAVFAGRRGTKAAPRPAVTDRPARGKGAAKKGKKEGGPPQAEPQDTSSPAAAARSGEEEGFWITTKQGRHIKVMPDKNGKGESELRVLSGRHAGKLMSEAIAADKEWREKRDSELEKEKASQEIMELRGQGKKGTVAPLPPKEEEVIEYLLDKDGYLKKQEKNLTERIEVLQHFIDKVDAPGDDEKEGSEAKKNWDKWIDAVMSPDPASKLDKGMRADVAATREEARLKGERAAEGIAKKSLRAIYDMIDGTLFGGKSSVGLNIPGVPGAGALILLAVESLKHTKIPGLAHLGRGVEYANKGVQAYDNWLEKKHGKVAARVIRATAFYSALAVGFQIGGIAGTAVALPGFGIAAGAVMAVAGSKLAHAGGKLKKGFGRVLAGMKERLAKVKAARAERERRKQQEGAAALEKAAAYADHDFSDLFAEDEAATFAAEDASFAADAKSLNMTVGEYSAALKEATFKLLSLMLDCIKKGARDWAVVAALCTAKGRKKVSFSLGDGEEGWARFSPPVEAASLGRLFRFAGRPATADSVLASFRAMECDDSVAAEFLESEIPEAWTPEDGLGVCNGRLCVAKGGSLVAGEAGLLRELHSAGLAAASFALDPEDPSATPMPEGVEETRPHPCVELSAEFARSVEGRRNFLAAVAPALAAAKSSPCAVSFQALAERASARLREASDRLTESHGAAAGFAVYALADFSKPFPVPPWDGLSLDAAAVIAAVPHVVLARAEASPDDGLFDDAASYELGPAHFTADGALCDPAEIRRLADEARGEAIAAFYGEVTEHCEALADETADFTLAGESLYELRKFVPVHFIGVIAPAPNGAIRQDPRDRARDLASLLRDADEAAPACAGRIANFASGKILAAVRQEVASCRDALIDAYGPEQARAIFGAAVASHATHPSISISAVAASYADQDGWPEPDAFRETLPSTFLREVGGRFANAIVAAGQGEPCHDAEMSALVTFARKRSEGWEPYTPKRGKNAGQPMERNPKTGSVRHVKDDDGDGKGDPKGSAKVAADKAKGGDAPKSAALLATPKADKAKGGDAPKSAALLATPKAGEAKGGDAPPKSAALLAAPKAGEGKPTGDAAPPKTPNVLEAVNGGSSKIPENRFRAKSLPAGYEAAPEAMGVPMAAGPGGQKHTAVEPSRDAAKALEDGIRWAFQEVPKYVESQDGVVGSGRFLQLIRERQPGASPAQAWAAMAYLSDRKVVELHDADSPRMVGQPDFPSAESNQDAGVMWKKGYPQYVRIPQKPETIRFSDDELPRMAAPVFPAEVYRELADSQVAAFLGDRGKHAVVIDVPDEFRTAAAPLVDGCFLVGPHRCHPAAYPEMVEAAVAAELPVALFADAEEVGPYIDRLVAEGYTVRVVSVGGDVPAEFSGREEIESVEIWDIDSEDGVLRREDAEIPLAAEQP